MLDERLSVQEADPRRSAEDPGGSVGINSSISASPTRKDGGNDNGHAEKSVGVDDAEGLRLFSHQCEYAPRRKI